VCQREATPQLPTKEVSRVLFFLMALLSNTVMPPSLGDKASLQSSRVGKDVLLSLRKALGVTSLPY
jgi:hypothetical protein